MKSFHESITKFFEEPTREKFRELVQFNTGEYDNLDFKKEWPESSKLAKHVLAFANSGGGIIIMGIEETDEKLLISCGVERIKDKATINSQLEQYLPTGLDYSIHDFSYSSSDYVELIGKSFQVMIVEYSPKLIPFISTKEGNGIKENSIYIRQGTSSILANYDQLQSVLNKRISTNYNTSSEIELEEHLAQLKILYDKIEKNVYVFDEENEKGIGKFLLQFSKVMSSNLIGERKALPNPNYPPEDYEEFISKMIEKKKARIQSLLEV